MLAKWVKFYTPLWKPAVFHWSPPRNDYIRTSSTKNILECKYFVRDKAKLYCHAACKPGKYNFRLQTESTLQRGRIRLRVKWAKPQVLCPLRGLVRLKTQTTSIMSGVARRTEFTISGSTFRMWQPFESMTGCVAGVFLQILLNFVQACHLRLCWLALFPLVIRPV